MSLNTTDASAVNTAVNTASAPAARTEKEFEKKLQEAIDKKSDEVFYKILECADEHGKIDKPKLDAVAAANCKVGDALRIDIKRMEKELKAAKLRLDIHTNGSQQGEARAIKCLLRRAEKYKSLEL